MFQVQRSSFRYWRNFVTVLLKYLGIRADYKTQWLGLDTNVYFEVLNIYGSRAVQELEYNTEYTEFDKDYQLPDMPLPSIGISITF